MCYASEQRELADRLAVTLRNQGHKVFLDRDDLPAGNSFEDSIRKAVNRCNLLVFLISPQSVKKHNGGGKYTLTELKYARERWPAPSGHVLPIIVEKTPLNDIPGYLRSVSLFEAEGDLSAEAVAEVSKIAKRRRIKAYLLYGLVIILLSGGIGSYITVSKFGYWPNYFNVANQDDVSSLKLLFGSNTRQIFNTKQQYSKLPIASEYKQDEVRYLFKNVNDNPSWKKFLSVNDCMAEKSYVVWLFKDDKLFRVSVRLYKDGSCEYERALQALRSIPLPGQVVTSTDESEQWTIFEFTMNGMIQTDEHT
jgi:hypothetical protein